MDFLTSILSHVPTGAELIAEAPIILTLILIEGLLSVDNALVLATMVRHLPEKQQKFALKAGLLGAYLFRGVALVFVGFLIANPWIKLVGGAYLIYLMCSHLGVAEEGEEGPARDPQAQPVHGLDVAEALGDRVERDVRLRALLDHAACPPLPL